MGRAGFPVKPHALKLQQSGLDIRVTVSVFLKRDQNVSGRIGDRVGDNQLALFRSRLCEDKRLHEKKLTPLREPRAGNSARACSMHGERWVRVIRLSG